MPACNSTRLLLLALALVIGGCGSNDSKVIGDWVGQSIDENGRTTPGANLSFDDQHHWRELFGNIDVQGKWSLSENTLTLTTELYRGLKVRDAQKLLLEKEPKGVNHQSYVAMVNNLDKPMDLTLTVDGKRLERKDAPTGAKVVYTRH